MVGVGTWDFAVMAGNEMQRERREANRFPHLGKDKADLWNDVWLCPTKSQHKATWCPLSATGLRR